MFRPVYLLFLLGACNVFDPPEGWDEFTAPHQYKVWHAEVQICVNEQRLFNDIVWRKVYADNFYCGGRYDATGCFDHPRTIYLAQLTLNSEAIVKAELIHYIRQNGLHDTLFKHCGG